MLLLLPPSEGKGVPVEGPAVDLDALAFPDLARARRAVMRDLVRLCRGSRATARAALGLGPTQDSEIDGNRYIATAPTLPAHQLYTGVLHDALGHARLPAAARRRAERDVLVFSGLWGAVRYADRLPRYRLPINARLSPGLASRWSPVLSEPVALAAGTGLVIDLRSAPYARAWIPRGDLRERTVVVSVLAERMVDGRTVVTPVSHFNKAAKGRFARELLLRPTDDLDQLAERAGSAGLRGSVTSDSRGLRLNLVEPWEAP